MKVSPYLTVLGVTSLLQLCVPLAFADTSSTGTPSASATPAKPSPKPEAREIRDEILALAQRGDGKSADWDAIDRKLQSYESQFGSNPESLQFITALRRMQLQLGKTLVDGAYYKDLLSKLLASSIPEVAAVAKTQKEIDDRLAQLKVAPMELSFTAVDGIPVNLAKLRGKVVLIDFWATWCGPCCAEVPNVVAAYRKYHDKGFEVLGISLDNDKSTLLAFAKSHDMPWPQCLDGADGKNTIARSFGIFAIPAMWLVDKKGMLVTTEAIVDLDGQVSKLLEK
jgi:thiol-disulfide isomerase/thioredoxin